MSSIRADELASSTRRKRLWQGRGPHRARRSRDRADRARQSQINAVVTPMFDEAPAPLPDRFPGPPAASLPLEGSDGDVLMRQTWGRPSSRTSSRPSLGADRPLKAAEPSSWERPTRPSSNLADDRAEGPGRVSEPVEPDHSVGGSSGGRPRPSQHASSPRRTLTTAAARSASPIVLRRVGPADPRAQPLAPTMETRSEVRRGAAVTVSVRDSAALLDATAVHISDPYWAPPAARPIRRGGTDPTGCGSPSRRDPRPARTSTKVRRRRQEAAHLREPRPRRRRFRAGHRCHRCERVLRQDLRRRARG